VLCHDCLKFAVFTQAYKLCTHSESEHFLGRTCAHENIIDEVMMDIIKDNFCLQLLNIRAAPRCPTVRLE
jgi:hypothetical protein